ncbi:MAG: Rrf2 family transcriptional regulator, partial [Gemmatimonadota bacterium]
MILSQAAKYAVRAALYLAQCQEAPVLGKEIAAHLHAPAHFLAKILQTLAKQGILHSYKGRGGGFSLARTPAEVTIVEVIQAIEGPRFGEGCFLGLAKCSEGDPCALHHEWKRIKDDLLGVLGGNTLQDLL